MENFFVHKGYLMYIANLITVETRCKYFVIDYNCFNFVDIFNF